MPLISLSGLDAIRTRKSNPVAGWGLRTEDNRVEPIAKPAFEVPFTLIPGERIFTIGSCFARHVEGELVERGFEIPMRDLFRTDAFEGLPTEIVNNFGVPSIFNELSWAFGEREFNEEQNFFEAAPGKFVDLHMVNSVRPASLETVRQRRYKLMEATRILADCRVLIVTLGLVELWWDEEHDNYLNTSPLPSVMKKHPGRFSLHVLSFDETLDYLKRALDIAFRHGRDDLKVLLTVSPVPMMATHRNVDVMIANSFSKSLLRTVAEHLVLTDDRITYFPSYESVTISDRNIAWSDDLIHVTRDMVAMNVERMVNAFTGQADASEHVLADAKDLPRESADALLLAEAARRARATLDGDFFERHAAAANNSPAFALEYGKYLKDQLRYEEAQQVLGDKGGVEMTILKAEILVGQQQFDEAMEVLKPLFNPQVKGRAHWRVRLAIDNARKSFADIVETEKEWLQCQPRERIQILTMTGRYLRILGKPKQALSRLKEVLESPDHSDLARIECATVLVELRKFKQASKILEGVAGSTDWQVTQITRLHKKIRKRLPQHP